MVGGIQPIKRVPSVDSCLIKVDSQQDERDNPQNNQCPFAGGRQRLGVEQRGRYRASDIK